MKKFYFACVADKKGKQRAFVLTVNPYNNIAQTATNCNLSILMPCETKKNAYETAAQWNDAFEQMGTLYTND